MDDLSPKFANTLPSVTEASSNSAERAQVRFFNASATWEALLGEAGNLHDVRRSGLPAIFEAAFRQLPGSLVLSATHSAGSRKPAFPEGDTRRALGALRGGERMGGPRLWRMGLSGISRTKLGTNGRD